MTTEQSHWNGDGFESDDSDEDILNLFDRLGIMYPEIKGMIDACKRDAWIQEKMAKHPRYENRLPIARFYWRRVERLRSLHRQALAELDAETTESEEAPR